MPSRIKLIAPTQYLLFTKTINLTLNEMFWSIGYENSISKRLFLIISNRVRAKTTIWMTTLCNQLLRDIIIQNSNKNTVRSLFGSVDCAFRMTPYFRSLSTI